MIGDTQRLIDRYSEWLRDKTDLRRVADSVEITTPYLDRHNDSLQIFLQRNGDVIRLTDDGYTIQDLEDSGCDLTPHRETMLATVLNGFGVEREGDALTVRASPETFAQRKHNLLQAMLAVGDLFYTAQATVSSLFTEDVAQWLKDSGVRFSPAVKFTGKSGLDQRFDFVIPSSPKAPERLVQAINHPNRANVQRAAFVWSDVRLFREPGTTAYVFINDAEESPRAPVLDALRAYEATPVVWSERDEVLGALAA